MRPFWTDPAKSPFSSQIHPALTTFADEAFATVAHLLAYVGTLALLAILCVHGWNQLQLSDADAGLEEPGWAVARHSYPAFALSSPDAVEKSGTYVILRHPEGGRKDILRWNGEDGRPVAELEIYRPGDEFDASAPPNSDLAKAMALGDSAELESAGVVGSKFGSVELLHQVAAKDGPGACLGFAKRFDKPALRLSGFSCQGDALPGRRAAIGCMLNRLMLLASGNDPKLAELFAEAELRRGSCSTISASADWLAGTENPPLRGAF